ncbi:DUF3307 domain-containing protein [Actibacterium lipolyticum]|uniref:DUF3307 domain-containing protein n=1 Tax=Actibacterium lipolyticum TaxID=1524263 RepID=A0A238KL80_9RHOB|nr:DUF3307 domain-containing protein [Actibacterium lipolyticum]SMX42832.1 hypothetical protein COL8621_02092 [Actibacterium lipolyticum]
MSATVETLAALLLAHALADFVFQTNAMIENKRKPQVQLLHGVIVLVLSLAAVGQPLSGPVWFLAALHLLTDRIKLAFGDTLGPFLLDQTVHIITICAIAIAFPTLWQDGWWADILSAGDIAARVPVIMIYLSGAILAVRAGGFAVAKLLTPYQSYWVRHAVLAGSLKDAGRLIGQLERGLTYLFVLTGQPTGVAVLIGAKSVLRFNTTKDERRLAEYVIIGTLASIGWAILMALGAQFLIETLTAPQTPLS